MNFLSKTKQSFKAIKLYCIDGSIDREKLIPAILRTFQNSLGSTPEEYDINGPYGIKKGSTVGLETFQKKLAAKGHDKYFALHGRTTGEYGFNLLLNAKTGEATYSELIIWYANGRYSPAFLQAIEPLITPLNVTCGFDIDIPVDHSILTETRIKKSIFGSISVSVNNNHLTWIQQAGNGAVRGIYKNNVVNKIQLAHLASCGIDSGKSIGHGLNYICFANEVAYQHAQSKYIAARNS